MSCVSRITNSIYVALPACSTPDSVISYEFHRGSVATAVLQVRKPSLGISISLEFAGQ